MADDTTTEIPAAPTPALTEHAKSRVEALKEDFKRWFEDGERDAIAVVAWFKEHV